MDLVAGVLGNLPSKLLELLSDEYKLQTGIHEQVKFLSREVESMHIALCKVAEVPMENLDPQVQLWSCEVREASYDMEDVLDKLLVRADNDPQPADADRVKRMLIKMGKLFSLSDFKARREIASAIEGIKKQLQEIAERRARYRVDEIVTKPDAATTIDPRLSFLYTKASQLVGMDEPRDAVIDMLSTGDGDILHKEMKIVSVFGFGGLGKTTLAKAVYEKLTVGIHYKAFVPVGRNPDVKKILRDILYELEVDCKICGDLDERQLIDTTREFLKDKRYFIVIDDIWEISSLKIILLALDSNNMGSKIVITTRKSDVAAQAHCSYKMKPLSHERSKTLFRGRIFGSEECPEQLREVSDKILKKCGGFPLAIVTISSMLANKLVADKTEWTEVCNSIGSGLGDSPDMNSMRRVLMLSYYELPPHLKTCLLYLSAFPEDQQFRKDTLVWLWIGEGFIQPRTMGDDLFELGESYLNELVCRNLVQPTDYYDDGTIFSLCVHDMVMDFICSLSKELNFVTLSDEKISAGSKLRRLGLKDTICWPTVSLSNLRSLVLFSSGTIMHSVLPLSHLEYLRVLHLHGDGFQNLKLNIGNLIHLRYLGLLFSDVQEFPAGIEKLRFLQVLLLGQWMNMNLPPTIYCLRQLIHVNGWFCPREGDLLRNLVSLRNINRLYLAGDCADAVEGLGHLTQLRELSITIQVQMGQSLCDALIRSLGNLKNLHNLSVDHLEPHSLNWEQWTPSPHLHSVGLLEKTSLQALPKWINPVSLPLLSEIVLQNVSNVGPDDIKLLGTLPNLWRLSLEAENGNLEHPLQKFVVSEDAFPRVTYGEFSNIVIAPSVFPQGAMPRVDRLGLCLRSRDFFSNDGFDFNDLSMGHLPSVKTIIVELDTGTSSTEEVAKVEEALRDAAGIHPNSPELRINTYIYPPESLTR
ncbi:unnamed protein product [Urochloa humidicola]